MLDKIPLGDINPSRPAFDSPRLSEWSNEADPAGQSTTGDHPFKISPVTGEAKVTVYPGTVNGVMAKIGSDTLDAATTPELTVVSGPLYLEIKYAGEITLSAEVKNAAALPTRLSIGVKYVQIGTISVTSGAAGVTAQIVTDNLTIPPDTLGQLVLSMLRPSGYSTAEDATKGWVSLGHVNNRVPTNIATPFALSTGLKVWVAIATNGSHPVAVTSCTLSGGAEVPADIGGTETTPPTTVHYLIGQVSGDGTSGSPFVLTSSGEGNLRLETYAVGTVCQTYDPGPPIVPAAVKTTYGYRVVRI